MSQQMDWIKLKVNMLDTPKFQIVMEQEDSHELVYIWTRLLLLAGKCGTSGELWMSKNIAYDIDHLSRLFGSAPQAISRALELFSELDMVELHDGEYFSITGWREHQDAEQLERTRELTRERVRRCRERKKSGTEGS